DLQSLWIEPIRRKLESLGVSIHLGRCLTRLEVEGGRVSRLHFAHAAGQDFGVAAQNVLLAVPVEKVVHLVDDRVYASAPALNDLRYLRARAMAAFNVYFKKRIDGMPSDHVNLLNSRYGISFIDVSQSWPGQTGTVLNLIASDFTDLEMLSPRVAVAALMNDLRRYLPSFGPEEIERVTFQSHVKQPLFMNDVGGWAYRPDAKTQLKNLYLAGDFARSHIDLVSMEGAISTGLRAAEAIRRDLSLSPPVET